MEKSSGDDTGDTVKRSERARVRYRSQVEWPSKEIIAGTHFPLD